MAEVIKEIKKDGTKDYSSIQLWINDLDEGSIYSAGDHAIGELYDEAHTEHIQFATNGETIGLNKITLRSKENQRGDGTAGSGPRIVGGSTTDLVIVDSNVASGVSFEFFEMDCNDEGMSYCINASTQEKGNVLNCILHNISSFGGNAAIYWPDANAGTRNIMNNFIYNLVSTGGFINYGIFIANVVSPVFNVINNSMFNIIGTNADNGDCWGIRNGFSAGQHTFKNNVIVKVRNLAGGSGWCYDTAITGTVDYNIDSDGSAPGTNTKTTAEDGSDVFTSSTDLRLPDADSDAYQFAEDVAATFPLASLDIRGRDRDAQGDVWDGGGYQFFVAPTPTPSDGIVPTLLFSMW
jgi:hypothetical protein